MNSVAMYAKETDVDAAAAVMRSILLGAVLGLACMADAQAQRNMAGRADDETAAQRIAPEDRDAAARGAADRLQGLHGNPEALLGAPADFDDPYRSAYDAAGQAQDALTNTQRVPRGALAGGRYGPQPDAQEQGKGGKGAPLRGIAGQDDARAPKVNPADPGTQTPMGAAMSLYRGPGDVGKEVTRVYKMPW